MPFTQDDFFVGMIAYFTVNDLRRHPQIRNNDATRDTKPRPFVCYAEADGECYWVGLTKTNHPDRRTVDRKWLRHPSGQFLMGDLIVNDGRNTYTGPIGAFADLSIKHDIFKGFYRPHLARPGVEQVEWIVRARGGMVPPARVMCPRPGIDSPGDVRLPVSCAPG
jgi:hypothetical protein